MKKGTSRVGGKKKRPKVYRFHLQRMWRMLTKADQIVGTFRSVQRLCSKMTARLARTVYFDEGLTVNTPIVRGGKTKGD